MSHGSAHTVDCYRVTTSRRGRRGIEVRAEVPEPPGTGVGTKAQVGGEVTTGVMVQDNATSPLKPFSGATVTVEVADTPAATDGGARFVASIVKSGVSAATLNATVCITQLPPATTAVAWQLPIVVLIWCSALSPFGWVRATVVNPVPGSGNAAGYRGPSHDEFRR